MQKLVLSIHQERAKGTGQHRYACKETQNKAPHALVGWTVDTRRTVRRIYCPAPRLARTDTIKRLIIDLNQRLGR